MRLEKKEVILLAVALFPSFAGLAISDPMVFFPCFSLSWIASIALCIEHQGRRTWRVIAAVIITAFFIFIGWRAYLLAEENESVIRSIAKVPYQQSTRAETKTATPTPPSRLADLGASIESNLKSIQSNLKSAIGALSPPPVASLTPSPATLTPHEIVADVKRAYPAFREETVKEYKGADVDWNLRFESASISSQPRLKGALEVFFVEEEPYNEDLIICYVPLKGHEYLRLLRRGAAFRVRGKIAGVNALNQLVLSGSSIEKWDLPKPMQPSPTPNTEASPP